MTTFDVNMGPFFSWINNLSVIYTYFPKRKSEEEILTDPLPCVKMQSLQFTEKHMQGCR